MEDERIPFDTRNKPRADTDLPDSLMPDAIYRPIPIAWFAGAVILNALALSVVYAIFSSKAGWFTVAGGLLAAAYVLSITWKRGMAGASLGWRMATVVVLTVNWLLVSLAAMAR